MSRYRVRPFGSSLSATRAVSLMFLLAVIVLLYDRMKDPATWKFLATEDEVVAEPAAPPKINEPAPETVVPGPNDLDETERKLWEDYERFIVDRAPLKGREMPAYWKLVAWSLTQPFHDFKRRARPEPPFTQLWENPGDYRGQPIRMRLHVTRVLEYPPQENPLGLPALYEAWGWTDGSKSYPYVVVFADRPEGLPIGPDVHAEAEFVGYYLKLMSYTAFDVKRGAPLLVGRMHLIQASAPRPKPAPTGQALEMLLLVFAVIAGGGWLAWRYLSPRKPAVSAGMPDEVSLEFAPPAGSDATPADSPLFFDIDRTSTESESAAERTE